MLNNLTSFPMVRLIFTSTLALALNWIWMNNFTSDRGQLQEFSSCLGACQLDKCCQGWISQNNPSLPSSPWLRWSSGFLVSLHCIIKKLSWLPFGSFSYYFLCFSNNQTCSTIIIQSGGLHSLPFPPANQHHLAISFQMRVQANSLYREVDTAAGYLGFCLSGKAQRGVMGTERGSAGGSVPAQCWLGFLYSLTFTLGAALTYDPFQMLSVKCVWFG